MSHIASREVYGAIGAWFISLFYLLSILIALVFLPATGFDGTADAFHNASVALPHAAEYPWLSLDMLKDALLGLGLILISVRLYAGGGQERILPLALALVGATLALGSAIVGYTSLMIVVDLWRGDVPEAEAAYLAITLITGECGGQP